MISLDDRQHSFLRKLAEFHACNQDVVYNELNWVLQNDFVEFDDLVKRGLITCIEVNWHTFTDYRIKLTDNGLVYARLLGE